MLFTSYTPTKICFGTLDYDSLSSEISGYGREVLILCGGKSTKKIAEKIADGIGKEFSMTLIDGIKSNPEIKLLEDTLNRIKKPDVILTVGGGSVHDSGKALSLGFTHSTDIEEYTTDGKLSVPGIHKNIVPVITIPTIFGTGSEVSAASLLRIDNRKRVIFSPYLYPKAAFIDASLADELPDSLCINAALDALTQGIESLVSLKAQSFSKRYSYSAIQRVISALLRLSDGQEKYGVSEDLALAAVEAMYAVIQTSVGAAHAISDPLSGRYDIHHGEAVATLLPYVCEANYGAASVEYDAVQDIIEEKTGRKFGGICEALLCLYEQIGFDCHMMGAKIDKAVFFRDFNEVIRESYNGDLDGNPTEMTDEIIRTILRKAVGDMR